MVGFGIRIAAASAAAAVDIAAFSPFAVDVHNNADDDVPCSVVSKTSYLTLLSTLAIASCLICAMEKRKIYTIYIQTVFNKKHILAHEYTFDCTYKMPLLLVLAFMCVPLKGRAHTQVLIGFDGGNGDGSGGSNWGRERFNSSLQIHFSICL